MSREWHDLGSAESTMTRVLLLCSGTVLVAALVVTKLMKTMPGAHGTAAVMSAGNTSVRVQQQLVVPVISIEAPNPPPVTRATAGRARTSAGGPLTLAHKARRTLLGDGRHKPEPFPRAR